MDKTQVGPHKFSPLSYVDEIYPKGRCRHCLWPRRSHPITFWAAVRFLGDKRRLNEREARAAES